MEKNKQFIKAKWIPEKLKLKIIRYAKQMMYVEGKLIRIIEGSFTEKEKEKIVKNKHTIMSKGKKYISARLATKSEKS